MRCVMCEEVGADCPLHGPAVNHIDAGIKLNHIRLENQVLRATVGALQDQLRAARRLVNQDFFRRCFEDIDLVAKEGQENLNEIAKDERLQAKDSPSSPFLVPIAMGYGRFRVIHNICRTALMDRGDMVESAFEKARNAHTR